MHALVPAVALVEDGGALVCTAQLLGVVADLLSSAFVAVLLDDGGGLLHVFIGDGLHLGPLCA